MARHLASKQKNKTTKKTISFRLPRILAVRSNSAALFGRGRRNAAAPSDRTDNRTDLILTCLSLLLLIIAALLPTKGLVRNLSFLLPFLLAGSGILFEAFQEAFMGIVFGREVIISLASLLCFCAGSFFGGAAVMVFLKVSVFVLSYGEELYSRRFDTIFALKAKKTRVVEGEELRVVSASSVKPGDTVELSSGERIPADGIVSEGSSVIDASDLTGDSCSFPVAEGSFVPSGCVNAASVLRIRLLKNQDDSLCSEMIRIAENCRIHKSRREQLLVRIQSYSSIALFAAAILVALVPSVLTHDWKAWLQRAAVVLTVSQSDSLIQTVALAFDCAAASASFSGILYKGHDILEELSRAETVVYDKTGTITEGKYTIKDIKAEGISENHLLFLAGAAEAYAKHPIGRSIAAMSTMNDAGIEISDFQEIPGRGVTAFVEKHFVCVGNAAMMEEHGLAYELPSLTGTAVHVSLDGAYIGYLLLDDAVRDGAFDVIEELRANGVNTNVLLTGDIHSSARKIASALNFDLVKAELTPDEKVDSVRFLMENRNLNTSLAFVGDGICDTEALSQATVGIVLGGMKDPDALIHSDVAVIDAELRKLPAVFRTAKLASSVLLQNAAICCAVKLLVLILALGGVIGPVPAVVIQTIAVAAETINAVRLLNDDGSFLLSSLLKQS